MKQRIGFIGLGNIGKPMAVNNSLRRFFLRRKGLLSARTGPLQRKKKPIMKPVNVLLARESSSIPTDARLYNS
jgi:hypothetical protein